MISVLLSRLVLLTFGTLYPAYASYKTVKTKNVRDYVKWMMYWIVFALYTLIEIFTDIFFSFWFPFYYELKILFVFWLICPATRGSTYLFKKVINPHLSKHEVALDSYIDSLWDHGYDIARKIGAQGLDYIVHLILELLRKGQITATHYLPMVNEIAQSNTVIQTPPKATIKSSPNYSQNNFDEEFDILMEENSDSHEEVLSTPSTNQLNNEELSDSDSVTEESKSVKSRPLKVAAKTKGKGMALRERKKRTAK